ncbi:leucine--tRNA ligase [Mucisphaera calidilacus]|uniref:Leucine--tRNA ligase n=1 Tax=Mucisphaera calidilacus TaxID=2527982 RepID=A0A518BZE9_9BACT|nr:leucine--tRNA ligase [Mucisphaera calidilacus]QDU72352.1 Leucine--tRNA ligase [Mucisphaera calidilacus]
MSTDTPVSTYDFAAIEQRWQAFWAERHTFHAPNPGDTGFDPDKPKFYVLDMFPYPSGVGLHVGHPLGYIATDIVGRYKRMQGYNVLHPMGFDAFGLPAEQFAVETGVHPRETTEKNISNMVRQLKRLGLGYDWNRQIATTDTDYYRWTQWIFLQLYNSYFDPVAKAARPITQLIEKLEGEDYYVGIDGELIVSGATEDLESIAGIGNPNFHKYQELEPDQRLRLIDAYRLAFLAEVDVNWCPALGTVLANEEVTNDGRSERGNHPVFKRPLKQWMLRITAYSDRLIDELDQVDWPEPIKLLQRNWIGRSTGAEVDFAIEGSDDLITVFTTRPDTLFGATYMVLAPEHPLVSEITTAEHRKAVDDYQAESAAKSEIDRGAEGKEKTGVFTGAYAINPVNQQRIPVWIADYVMMGYGTGAIMAVPAHDERDHAFASKFGLPIVRVVEGGDRPIEEEAFTGNGPAVNSANDDLSLDGLSTPEAKARMTQWLADNALGKAKVQTKLRDWLFSRQRYWGEPFPILHELDDNDEPTGSIRGVPEKMLPVEHPHLDDFRPEAVDDPNTPPRPPLGRAPGDWTTVEIDGRRYRREFNTMPQWAGSCWYYLRFLDPANLSRFVDPDAEKYWMTPSLWEGDAEPAYSGGVDLYVGGAEHAVLHLLYARFWHKVLFDLGHVSTPEPFGRLFNQGYIQAYYYEKENGTRVEATQVTTEDGRPAFEAQGQPGTRFLYEGEPVVEKYGKMGKSLKNAVAPDDVCAEYGADTLRLYEMAMGPLDQSKPWNTKDITGVHRFLNRVWRNFYDAETGELVVVDDAPAEELDRFTHKTIARVTDAMESMSFNVAIAAMIELNNQLVALPKLPRAVADALVRMLSPLAPHLAEELWAALGNQPSVADAPWPSFDPDKLLEETIEMPVQVNGKLRGKIMVPADADQPAVEEAAKADANVGTHLEGKTIRKVIIVPGKLINIVAS